MLKVEYRDHIGFENKRLENEIHSRMTVERDARLKKLELTEAGIRMQEGTIRNINRLESTLRQGISDEDLEVFFRVIRKMRSNIEIQQGETNRRRE